TPPFLDRRHPTTRVRAEPLRFSTGPRRTRRGLTKPSTGSRPVHPAYLPSPTCPALPACLPTPPPARELTPVHLWAAYKARGRCVWGSSGRGGVVAVAGVISRAPRQPGGPRASPGARLPPCELAHST